MAAVKESRFFEEFSLNVGGLRSDALTGEELERRSVSFACFYVYSLQPAKYKLNEREIVDLENYEML
ncbi:hypothetical protein LJB89_01030 [Tyzzerella sp. OttesenSCG-928-J15]|nr:hypothetical protein [Tyzzerella sp. OttesenSCG-928-J15]